MTFKISTRRGTCQYSCLLTNLNYKKASINLNEQNFKNESKTFEHQAKHGRNQKWGLVIIAVGLGMGQGYGLLCWRDGSQGRPLGSATGNNNTGWSSRSLSKKKSVSGKEVLCTVGVPIILLLLFQPLLIKILTMCILFMNSFA